MTWKLWRSCFQFKVTLDYLLWITPWFLIWISDGAKDANHDRRWWGLRFHWGFNKKGKAGDFIHLKKKEWVMKTLSTQQMYFRRLHVIE